MARPGFTMYLKGKINRDIAAGKIEEAVIKALDNNEFPTIGTDKVAYKTKYVTVDGVKEIEKRQLRSYGRNLNRSTYSKLQREADKK
jgi:hypothetical protein